MEISKKHLIIAPEAPDHEALGVVNGRSRHPDNP